jgi:hypothetical protein
MNQMTLNNNNSVINPVEIDLISDSSSQKSVYNRFFNNNSKAPN